MATRILRAGPLAFTADVEGDGPLVLCLHGFPDHRRSWRHQLGPLAAAGFRVVAPTMRGYEPSSQPADRDYTMASLAGDVLAWMDDLGADRAHLVGHDWGAVVTYAAAAVAPERVASLAGLAVPPLRRVLQLARVPTRALRNLWYMGFFQLPLLPRRVLLARDGAFVRWLWQVWSPGWSPEPGELDAVVATLREPGVADAVLRYYKDLAHLETPGSRESWRLLTAPLTVRALLVTGETDGCMAPDFFGAAIAPGDLPPGSACHHLGGVGHFLHQEDPARVNRLLLDHLRAAGA